MKIGESLSPEEYSNLFHLDCVRFIKELSKKQAILLFSSEELPNPYLSERLGIYDDFVILAKDSEMIVFLPFPIQNNDSDVRYASFSELESMLKKINGALCLNFSSTKLSTFFYLNRILQDVIFINVENVLNAFFSLKTEHEIESISSASKLTAEVFNNMVKAIKSKTISTEKQAFQFIKQNALRNEAELAFKPIIASAKHSSYIHYQDYSEESFDKGFLLLDIGFKINNICSDMTRMIYLGSPSKYETELFNKVRQIKKRCIEHSLDVASAKELQEFAQSLFKKEGFILQHAIGHGIGYRVHEPLLFYKAESKQNPIAIEPGIYIKDKFGIRIEDTLIINDSARILTSCSDNLVIIN